MSIWYFVVGLALYVVGCGGKDMAQTPETPQTNNSPPSIRINDAAFVPASGTVRVQWVQTNADAVTGYVLERKLSDDRSFSSVIKTTTSALTPTSANVLSLQDTSVFAGEQIAYRVGAETSDGKVYYSNDVSITLPGARLERTELKQENATVHLQWRADMEQALSYEVLRKANDNPSEVVFVARDPAINEFGDGPLQGNVRYTYQVRTVLKSGVRVSSRMATSGVYLNKVHRQVTSALDARMRLALVSTTLINTTSPMICVLNHNELDIEVLKVPGVELENLSLIRAHRPQITLLQKESISFTGHTLHSEQYSETFVTGIQPDTRSVIIQMYLIETNVWTPVADKWEPAPKIWQVEDDYQRTAVARDPNGRLFVAAGGMIKAFSISNMRVDNGERKAELVELGSASIPDKGDPGDLVVTSTFIWLSLPNENRLMRGQVQFTPDGSLQNINWQDISPPGVLFGPITVNQNGNVLLLDLHNYKIWMLNPNGQVITQLDLSKTGFESTSGKDGDLIAGIAGIYDLLFVSNAIGELTLFKTE